MQERHRPGLRHGGRRGAGGEHRRPRSSPVGSPRSCGWESRWAPRGRRWQVWPASATSSLRARRRNPATVRSASGSGRAAPWSRRCAAAGGHIAEGVASCQAVLALADSYDVEMPLTDAVNRVCHKGLSVDRGGGAAARAQYEAGVETMDGQYGDSTRSVKAVGSAAVPGQPVASPPVLGVDISPVARRDRGTGHLRSLGRIRRGGNWSRRSPNSRVPRRRWRSAPGWPLSRRCCGCSRSRARKLVVPADGYYQVRRYAKENLAPQGVTVVRGGELPRSVCRGVRRRRGAGRDSGQSRLSTSSTCTGWR